MKKKYKINALTRWEVHLPLATQLYEVSSLPVMFCRKMRGIFLWQHSSMKCLLYLWCSVGRWEVSSSGSTALWSVFSTCDVLEEDERYLPLAAQLYEVCPLQGGLGEKDTVVANDAHRVPVQSGEPWIKRGFKYIPVRYLIYVIFE